MTEQFFVVGAQRSGTTYLRRMLADHPEIEMAEPEVPEPKFFLDDDIYSRGIEWYEKYFYGSFGPKARGEKSTSYLESELAADRIFAAYPTAKIIAILRDPVDRALSNYYYSVSNGLETRPVEKALGEEDQVPPDTAWLLQGKAVSASPFAYRARGRYVEGLRRYAARFGRDNIKVLILEDTVGQLEEVAEIYRFLDVDRTFSPPTLHEAKNAATNPGVGGSPELEADLRRYFTDANALLALEFDLDLSTWLAKASEQTA